MSLEKLKKRQQAKIVSIKVNKIDKEIINSLGVRTGKHIKIMYSSFFSKTVAYMIDSQIISIPYKHQKLINVEII